MKKIIIFGGYLVIASLIFILFLKQKQEFVQIESQNQEGIISTSILKNKSNIICIAVAPVISPKASIILYTKLKDYISNKLQKKVEIIYRETYKEINELLLENVCDLAFVCTGAYIKDLMDKGVQILVVPNVNGKTIYNSYIITNAKNHFNKFEDLKGKKFAFTDPLSLSGFLYVKYRLKKINSSIESFFYEIVFTKSHDNSIKAVAENIVDGACVDSMVYEVELKNKTDLATKLKIIEISPDFGIPPIVVKKEIDNKTKSELKKIFLKMAEDQQGKKILELLGIQKFEAANEQVYLELKQILNKENEIF